jgi:hypothetical protein
MSTNPPTSSDDAYHLRAIEVAFYIWGAVMLFASFTFAVFGPDRSPLPWLIGVAAVYGVICLAAGVGVHLRRARAASIAVALVITVFVPIGTLIGLLAIAVLVRPSVRNAYRARVSAAVDKAEA